MKRLFRQGLIAAEDSPSLLEADVLVEGGTILEVSTAIEATKDTEVVKCRGCVLIPALFDLNVHAREASGDDREDLTSCSEAAINGGVTGIVLQPDTAPAIDSGSTVQAVLDIARERTRIGAGIYTSGTLTKGRKGEEIAGIAGMKARGALYLTDAGEPVSNPQVLRRAMEYARQFDLPVALHCEVRDLIGKGAMHEGSVSYSLGLQGMPAIAEEIGIARDIRLAEYCGVHLHVKHVSTREGMETIKRAKERGIRVTCEVTPHHLIFNHTHIGNYDTHYKVNPPLRTEEDNAALLEGLKKGWFDVIASDHSPHTEFETNQDFASAPFGVTSLETALPSLYHYFVKTGQLGWDVLVKRYSAEPRRLMKLAPVPIKAGGTAEFVVFNPERTTTFSNAFLRSRGVNTPFLGKTLSGLVERVVVRGEDLLVR